jgi:hypothetical protein
MVFSWGDGELALFAGDYSFGHVLFDVFKFVIIFLTGVFAGTAGTLL